MSKINPEWKNDFIPPMVESDIRIVNTKGDDVLIRFATIARNATSIPIGTLRGEIIEAMLKCGFDIAEG